MKFKIYKYDNVTSSNDIAIELIKSKKKLSGCVCAKFQSKGRGRYGKKWISKKGNLFATIFFHLGKKYPVFNEFSLISPIIVSDVIKKICTGSNISLKFPNDIFLNGKKVCGILQEKIVSEGKNFLIIGIGINVISSPNLNDRYKATNIFSETNKKININEIVDLIIFSYENFFKKLNSYNYKNFKKRADLISVN